MRRHIESTTKTMIHVPRQGLDGCIGINIVYHYYDRWQTEFVVNFDVRFHLE